VQAIPYYETFFVYGHIPLGFYIDSAGIRAGDRIFSVIRDPIEMMLSQANYAITLLRQDPLGNDPDTREILEWLDLRRLPDPLSLAELKQVAVRALLHPEIARSNQICFYLGGEESARYDAAVSNLVRYDVEITTTRQYRRWLEERWGIASGSRHNVSDHWISADDLDDSTFAGLRERTAEDQKVFDVVSWVLDKKGTASATGTEIAETVGPQLLDTFAESLISASRERPRHSGRRLPIDLKVVQGKGAIAAALDAVSNADAALRVVFGIEGNCRPYLRDGWANPEPDFVWTSGPSSWLELPKPGRAGDYVLQLLAGPFVIKDRLPSQRLTLIVNGIILGTAVATERAIIECAVPQAVLGGGDVVHLTFTLPDAARAADITGTDDQRTLGFAVERIELSHRDTLEVEPATILGGEQKPPAAADAAVATVPIEAPAAARSVQEPELPVGELMMRFESLGENCEFGLVQRSCGAEPLGLFRFASAPLPKLLAGLEAGFEGLSDADNLDVQLSSNGREYMVYDKRFQLLYHAWVSAEEMSAGEVHQREMRRLPLLIRKLIEDLREAEKIFIFHGMEPLGEEEARRLLALLRSYGPNTLLWIEGADAEHPPGTVAWIGEGLLKAYIDRFAPGEDAHDLSLDCWIAICRGAYRLWRIGAGGDRTQLNPVPAAAAAQ
jgi:hypothetical protein